MTVVVTGPKKAEKEGAKAPSKAAETKDKTIATKTKKSGGK